MNIHSKHSKAASPNRIADFTRTPVRTVRTLGDRFRTARFAHGLTLEDVAGALLVQKKHLERIENNELGEFYEQVYLESILRTYSTYLGLSWDAVQKQYHASRVLYCAAPNSESPPVPFSKMRQSHFWITPNIVRAGAFALIITTCFSYIIFLGYQMMRPPQLLIVSPQNNSLSAVDTIEVVGRVAPRAQVSINGEYVSKSEDGAFRQTVGLQEGVNVIAVSATKKFGKPKNESRTVIFSRDVFEQSSQSAFQELSSTN